MASIKIDSMNAHRNYTEPRIGRAVLGDKTTNAKAKNNPAISGKNNVEKSQLRPNTSNRHRPLAPKSESNKLQILLDQSDPLNIEIDTNAPPPPALPYRSDVFPAGVLTFDAVRPENRMTGYYEYYHNRRDENGMTRLDREEQAMQEERFKKAEAQIRKDLDENFVWDLGLDSPKKSAPECTPTLGTVSKTVPRPGATSKVQPTLNQKRAASALGMAPKPSATSLQRKPLASKPAAAYAGNIPSYMQPTKAKQASTSILATRTKAPTSTVNNTGLAASRSTLGYTKGRNASSAVRAVAPLRSVSDAPSRVFARSNAAASSTSETATTLASHATNAAMPKPEFVSIFEPTPSSQVHSRSMDDSDASPADSTIEPLVGWEDDDGFQLELNL